MEEWFDFYCCTTEQCENILNDTEFMDWALYNDEYWNYGNYSFTSLDDIEIGIEAHNAPVYPVTGYEDGKYFSDNNSACTHHLDKNDCPESGGCGCRCVNNSIQCMGFANFFRWVRTGNYLGASSQTPGMSGSWTESNIKNYFQSKVNLGSHVRLHLKGKPEEYRHSITVVAMSNSGVTVYDCNWDKQCGIRIKDLSWSDIYMPLTKLIMSIYLMANIYNYREES